MTERANFMFLALARQVDQLSSVLHPRVESTLWRCLHLLGGRRTMVVPYGKGEIEIDLRQASDRQALNRRYDHGLLRLLEAVLRPGDVFVDAGANAGLVSFLAADLVGPSGLVIGLEPNPELADRIARSARSRAAHGSGRVHVVQAALSDQSGEATLVVPGASTYAALREGGVLPDYPVTATVKVPTERIESVVQRLVGREARVRLLKLDIQGLEGRVLLDAEDWLLSPEGPEWVVFEFNREDEVLLRGSRLLKERALWAVTGDGLMVATRLERTPPGTNLVLTSPNEAHV